MHWEMHGFELPMLPCGKKWHIFANTNMECGEDIWSCGDEIVLENQSEILVGERSIIVLISK